MNLKSDSIKFDLSDEDLKSITTNNLKGLKIAKLSETQMQQLNGGFAVKNAVVAV